MKYRHIGTQPLVLDGGRTKDGSQIDLSITPGSTFDATLAPEHEAFLVKARVIEPISTEE
jgi:hypothetical protein